MKASNYTSGPWHVEDGVTRLAVVSDRDFTVAHLIPDAQGYVDAQLVIAAPDLLAALEAIIPGLSHYVAIYKDDGALELLTAARAAIAKATGGAA